MKEKKSCIDCNITYKVGVKTQESRCPRCRKVIK